MRPLLWKEMRELRWWVVCAALAAVAFGVWCKSPRFDTSYLENYMGASPMFAAIVAASIGARQIARERHSRTLEFLLARPVSPLVILGAKFLAGSAAVALITALIGAAFFAVPKNPMRIQYEELRRAVGYSRYLWMVVPRVWVVYAISLLCSAMVNRTAKAMGAVVVTVVAIWMGASFYSNLSPFADVDSWMAMPDVWWAGVEPLRDPRLVGLAVCVVALAVMSAAMTLFRLRPAWVVSNRALAIGAAVVVGLSVLSGHVDASLIREERPVGSLEVRKDKDREIIEALAASGDLAIAATGTRISVVDFSDAAHPRLAAEGEPALWTTKKLLASGPDVWVVGTKKALPSDEVEIALARVDGGAVRLDERIKLGPDGAVDTSGGVSFAAGYVIAGVAHKRECRLEVYDAASGRQAATVTLDSVAAPMETCAMRSLLVGTHLYVTTPAALTTFDVTDPSRPVVASRLPSRPHAMPHVYFFRDLASDGQRLLEGNILPNTWTIWDLRDAGRPQRVNEVPRNEWAETASGKRLYWLWRGGVLEFRASERGPEAVRRLVDEHEGGVDELAVSGKMVYGTKGRRVLGYRVE